MLGVLLGNDSKVADLKPVVGSEIFQGILVVLGDLVRYQTGHGVCEMIDELEKNEISVCPRSKSLSDMPQYSLVPDLPRES